MGCGHRCRSRGDRYCAVGQYWVEGHAPAELIRRLMAEKPKNIRGIAVPGMPIRSLGMEGPNPVEYEVLAYDTVGTTRVYAIRQGRAAAEKAAAKD